MEDADSRHQVLAKKYGTKWKSRLETTRTKREEEAKKAQAELLAPHKLKKSKADKKREAAKKREIIENWKGFVRDRRLDRLRSEYEPKLHNWASETRQAIAETPNFSTPDRRKKYYREELSSSLVDPFLDTALNVTKQGHPPDKAYGIAYRAMIRAKAKSKS